MKQYFYAFIDCFTDLGKEVFSFLVLGTGLLLLIKGFVNGQQYVDLVKTIGVAYIGGAAVGSTSDAIIKHLETRALAIKDKLEGNK